MAGSERPSPEPLPKKRRPQPYWGGRILEMLWSNQMHLIIGLGGSQEFVRNFLQKTPAVLGVCPGVA